MTIDEIRADYARHNGGHWFDKDTIRFWGTRFSEQTFTTPCDGSRTYFVTSEYDGPLSRSRLYSVRVYDSTTHEVDTISFQQDKTAKLALKRAKFLAGAAHD